MEMGGSTRLAEAGAVAQSDTLGSHQSNWGSHGGLVGKDCPVPIPMGLLQLSLVCASDDSCGGSPEVTGDMI